MKKPKTSEYIYYVHETNSLIRFRAFNYDEALGYLESNKINKIEGELFMNVDMRTRDED